MVSCHLWSRESNTHAELPWNKLTVLLDTTKFGVSSRARWEEEVPENVKEKLTVHFVSQMHEVLRIALGV